jgi:bifunctional non-homologous end joining protein LigD
LSQEFVVGGFTEPQGKRAGLGALLVGYYDRNELVFAGKIGTGFNMKMLLDLRAQLDRLEIDKPPFTQGVGLPRSKVGARSKAVSSLRAHWVHPEIVVQVGFIQWTEHNKLRHPRLLGIRNDKHPREVVRE